MVDTYPFLLIASSEKMNSLKKLHILLHILPHTTTNSPFTHNTHKRKNNLFLYKKMSQQLTELLSVLNKAEEEVEAIISNSSLEDLATIYLDMLDKMSPLIPIFERCVDLNKELLEQICIVTSIFTKRHLPLFENFKGVKLDESYLFAFKFPSLKMLNDLIKDDIFPFDDKTISDFLPNRMIRYRASGLLKYDHILSITLKDGIPKWFLKKIFFEYKQYPTSFCKRHGNQLRKIFQNSDLDYFYSIFEIMNNSKNVTTFPKLFLDLGLYKHCSFLTTYLNDKITMSEEDFESHYEDHSPCLVHNFFREN